MEYLVSKWLSSKGAILRYFYYIIIGQATIKVKGNALSDSGRFFDAVDLVIPPQEEGGVFITTNYVLTHGQRIQNITGYDKKGNAPAEIPETCNSEGRCDPFRQTKNGITTGRYEDVAPNDCRCKITTWAPLEDDETGRTNILTHV